MEILSKKQIKSSIELLNRIRTDEGELFPHYVNGEEKNHNEIENVFIKYLEDNDNVGVFTSLVYYGLFRIFIAFEKDTLNYTQTLMELIHFVKDKIPNKILKIHFIADQVKLISEIQKHFLFEPPFPNGFYYSSHEFVMDIENFKGFSNTKNLIIKNFESNKIDDYALLLDNAMTFVSPPPNFQRNKEDLANDIKDKCFYAFFCNNELVGIYWLDNDLITIEYLAISPIHQRKGYGSIILSHAINNILFEQKKKMAKLYCVDWNKKRIGILFKIWYA